MNPVPFSPLSSPSGSPPASPSSPVVLLFSPEGGAGTSVSRREREGEEMEGGEGVTETEHVIVTCIVTCQGQLPHGRSRCVTLVQRDSVII